MPRATRPVPLRRMPRYARGQRHHSLGCDGQRFQFVSYLVVQNCQVHNNLARRVSYRKCKWSREKMKMVKMGHTGSEIYHRSAPAHGTTTSAMPVTAAGARASSCNLSSWPVWLAAACVCSCARVSIVGAGGPCGLAGLCADSVPLGLDIASGRRTPLPPPLQSLIYPHLK